MLENFHVLMELNAGYFGMSSEERSEFLEKMPTSFPEKINYLIDGRFEDVITLVDWYRSAMKKIVKDYRVYLTVGEVVAIRAVIVCCDIKLSEQIKALFSGVDIYFYVLKSADRFLSTILPLLSKDETDRLVRDYRERAMDFGGYSKKYGGK